MSIETLKSGGDTIRDRLVEAATNVGYWSWRGDVQGQAELAAASQAHDEWVQESVIIALQYGASLGKERDRNFLIRKARAILKREAP